VTAPSEPKLYAAPAGTVKLATRMPLPPNEAPFERVSA
jgi:hypothetical protein